MSVWTVGLALIICFIVGMVIGVILFTPVLSFKRRTARDAMSETMTPVHPNSSLMKAWTAYKQTDDYANARKWALNLPEPPSDEFRMNCVEGSLWAMFMAGFQVASSASSSSGAEQRETEAQPAGGAITSFLPQVVAAPEPSTDDLPWKISMMDGELTVSDAQNNVISRIGGQRLAWWERVVTAMNRGAR